MACNQPLGTKIFQVEGEVVTTRPATPAAPAPVTPQVSADQLPRTGAASTVPLADIALGLLAIGSALLAFSRRREHVG
jgi:LPXTG-motif cell wall-anchored protein